MDLQQQMLNQDRKSKAHRVLLSFLQSCRVIIIGMLDAESRLLFECAVDTTVLMSVFLNWCVSLATMLVGCPFSQDWL